MLPVIGAHDSIWHPFLFNDSNLCFLYGIDIYIHHSFHAAVRGSNSEIYRINYLTFDWPSNLTAVH